jgi:hypothetical protein
MHIRITGTPEEAISVVQHLRAFFEDMQVSSFEPRDDGSRLGTVVVVTSLGDEEAT